MRLEGRVAIVTGSSRGIGKAIAVDFAREGAKVVVAARTEVADRLAGTIYDTVEEIKGLGQEAIAVKCDVSSEEDVRAMVNKALQEFGQIDVLVNNAGLGSYRLIKETTAQHWDLVMRVNLRGPFLCIKEVLPTMMERRKGSIINISSAAAQEVFSRVPRPDGVQRLTGCAYGASKAALERFTIGLAEEVRGYNIAVNALKPSRPIYSPGVASWNPDVGDKAYVSPHLFMTKAAIFLAAQDASSITGGLFFDEELCQKYGLA